MQVVKVMFFGHCCKNCLFDIFYCINRLCKLYIIWSYDSFIHDYLDIMSYVNLVFSVDNCQPLGADRLADPSSHTDDIILQIMQIAAGLLYIFLYFTV